MSASMLYPIQASAIRWRATRWIIPLCGVLVLAAFAALWLGGWKDAYLGIQRALGTSPYTLPFLDTHALLSAAECQRQGIDVYTQNPCDALGRVHAYSPLWLSLIPGFLGTGDTAGVGLGLDLIFILSLGIVFRPRSRGEVAVFALAVFSPITLFAVERANCDLMIFLLLVGAAMLWTGSERARLVSYAVCLLAGALKYFPMVALALVLRERWRRGFTVAAAVALAIVLLIAGYHGELHAALANIPAGHDYFSDVFSARNLPLGLLSLTGLSEAPAGGIIAAALFFVAGVAALSRAWRTVRLLEPVRLDWTEWEMRILAIGSLLLPACFLTAQNVAYRGVYLLLVVPGLVRLRQAAGDRALRGWLGGMIAVCIAMLWECAIALNIGLLLQLSPQLTGSGLYPLLQLAYWLGRELLWWWLVADLVGIVLSFMLAQPLTNVLFGLLRRPIPRPVRR